MSEIDNIVIGGSNKELPIHQLNKLREDNSGRDNIFPLTLLQAVYDKTGIRLDSIISSFNYIFVPYAGTKEDTRLKVLSLYRRKGLVICYKDFEDNVIIEMYKDNERNDDDWKNDDNWIDFKSFVENIVNTNLGDYVTDIKVEDNKLQFKSQGDESYSVIYDFKTIFDNINNVAQTLTKNINTAKEELTDDINDVKEELNDNIGTVKDELEKSISEVGSELNDYKTSNDKVVVGINEKIESVNKDISDINESIDATNEEITTIKDNVDNISNKVDGLDGAIKTDGTSTQYLGGDGKYHNILEYDDVIDVYADYESSPVGDIINIHLYEDAAHQTEITTGNPKTIYQDITADSPGYQFKWSGSQFVKVGGSSLVLGTTEGTAFEGSAGKELADNFDKLPRYVVGGNNKENIIGINNLEDGSIGISVSVIDKVLGIEATESGQIPLATTDDSGLMPKRDKQKLDSIINTGKGDKYLGDDFKYHDAETYKNVQHVLDYYTDLAGCNGIIEDNVYNTLNALIQKTDIRPILISKEDGVNGFKVFNVISARSDGNGGIILKAIHINDSSFTDNENDSVIYTIKIDSSKNISKTEFTINTNGNGTKFLADDGEYKTIDINNSAVFLTEEDFENGEAEYLTEAGLEKINNAIQNLSSIAILSTYDVIFINRYAKDGENIYLNCCVFLPTLVEHNIEIIGFVINTSTRKITRESLEFKLLNNGDGTKYLSDDGTYKTINPQTFTLSQTYAPASDKFIPNYPAANDTYEGAIAKLHNMINKLQTKVTELETALTAKEVNDSQEHPLG